MKNELIVCWLSAGVSSFIAGYLMRDKIDKYIYIDIEDQHPDSIRFIKDCEKILNKKIEILKSPYKNVENVIIQKGVIKINNFAPCTNILKKDVRKEWEQKFFNFNISYVWGFDVAEIKRAERLKNTMFEFKHYFPLIDANLTKEDAHALCKKIGIKRPLMYDLGYKNNNCLGCIKGGAGYWNKIKKDFPEIFRKRAELERKIKHSILKNCYLDELKEDTGRNDEIIEECSIFCILESEALKNE